MNVSVFPATTPASIQPMQKAGRRKILSFIIKVRAGDRRELREGAGGVEGELHVPCGAKEGLRTYL